METTPTLNRISRERLSSLLLEQQKNPSSPSQIAIIDVRDGDYIGGHILTSTHIPSQTLPHRTPALVHTLRPYPIVVFHCALSQQRGPSAALNYIRERKRLLLDDNDDEASTPELRNKNKEKVEGGVKADTNGEGVLVGEEGEEFKIFEGSVERGDRVGDGRREEEGRSEGGGQEVFVLDGGFVKWQEKYGGDERLTEGWVKDIWEDGY
ncbi:MAG: hypothetical protein M1812_003027 [Candelaria pacifica]|nr:MAG: hypothetical protein M1812_003027 [Candelaria pacifica]